MQVRALTMMLFFLTFLLSCKKEGDAVSPVVEFLEPESGHVYYEKSIAFKVRVSDNNNLQRVKLGIVDLNHVPVIQGVELYPGVNDTIIEFSFDATGITIQDVLLYVHATDGPNTKNKYLQAFIETNIDGHFEILIGEKSGDVFNLHRLEYGSSQAEKLLTIPSSIVKMLSGGTSGIFYLITDYPSRLQARLFPEGNLLWEFVAPMPDAEFTDFHLHGDKIVVVEKSGRFRMFHALTGATVEVNQLNEGKIPSNIFMDEDYVFLAQRSNITQPQVLSLFYTNTLQLFRSFHLDMGIVGILTGTDNYNIILVHQNEGEVSFSTFNKSTLQTSLIGQLQFSKIQNISKISTQELLLTGENQVAVWNLNPGQLSVIASGDGFLDALKQNPDSGIYYYAKGSNLYSTNSDNMIHFQGTPTMLLNVFYKDK
ncbi:MAG: hypothetical protein Q8S18_03830 [Bacteroidales bacterium]|nr:hypothetical protein [Bacteroidales bacterium]